MLWLTSNIINCQRGSLQRLPGCTESLLAIVCPLMSCSHGLTSCPQREPRLLGPVTSSWPAAAQGIKRKRRTKRPRAATQTTSTTKVRCDVGSYAHKDVKYGKWLRETVGRVGRWICVFGLPATEESKERRAFGNFLTERKQVVQRRQERRGVPEDSWPLTSLLPPGVTGKKERMKKGINSECTAEDASQGPALHWNWTSCLSRKWPRLF